MAATGDIYANLSVTKMNFHEISALAEEFVLQYYTVMDKCPELLHRFYSDDSVLIYECPPAFGQQKIYSVFMDLNLKDTRVLIHKVDALKANKNSVLIQVCGEISISRAAPRRFMRSFTLCEKKNSDFYVLNDIFRYQDRVYTPKPAEHVEDPVPEVKPRTPVVESLSKVHKSNGEQTQEQTWQPQPPVMHAPEPPIQIEPEPVVRKPSPVPPSPEPIKEPEPQPEPIVEPARTPSPVQPVVNAPMSWAGIASGNQSVQVSSRVPPSARHAAPTEPNTVPQAPVKNAPASRGNAPSNAQRQRGNRNQQADLPRDTGDIDQQQQHARGGLGGGRHGAPPRGGAGGGRGGPRGGGPRGAGVSTAPGSGAARRGGK